jgi:hypothetical protein
MAAPVRVKKSPPRVSSKQQRSSTWGWAEMRRRFPECNRLHCVGVDANKPPGEPTGAGK